MASYPNAWEKKYEIMLGWERKWASQVALGVKNPFANAGDIDSIPGSERSPGRGDGNLLQYSCLENPLDRGAWRVTVHRLTELDTTAVT